MKPKIKYYDTTSKGDNVPWHNALVGSLSPWNKDKHENVLFECFPYRHEYLTLGCGVSVIHCPYDKKEWRVKVRIWNTETCIYWKEFSKKDKAFLDAYRLVMEFRSIGGVEFERKLAEEKAREHTND